MQWSSRGLRGERELEEGKVCFWEESWRWSEGRGMEAQALGQASTTTTTNLGPSSPCPLQPTHLHLWTSAMTRWVSKRSEEDEGGGCCRLAPSFHCGLSAADIKRDIGWEPRCQTQGIISTGTLSGCWYDRQWSNHKRGGQWRSEKDCQGVCEGFCCKMYLFLLLKMPTFDFKTS